MTDAEIKDRQEFAYEAAVRMRDRFLSQEVWERHGVNPRDVVPLVLNDPTRELFQPMLFSKIVPNCKKLGLLDRNDRGCATASRRWASSSSRTSRTPARSTSRCRSERDGADVTAP